MLPERPFSYRAGDDEDHRLALCGLTPDERTGEELEDFQARHSDFMILRVSPPSAKQGPGDAGRSTCPPGVAVSPGPTPNF